MACAGSPTWNAWLCVWLLTVPGAQALAAAGQTTAGSSANEPDSLGICHTCPVGWTSTILYAPGWSDGCRCGGADGSDASSSVGRTTTVTRSVSTGGALPFVCGCSAVMNGVGSIAAGITCVTVVFKSGNRYCV